MDVITFHRLRMLDLDPDEVGRLEEIPRARCVYEAFLQRVPYENLSENLSVESAPDEPESWPRATDRLLRENVAHGLGGTSFSMAYALRDLLRGAGLAAHCALAYNLVTEEPHAAVLVYLNGVPWLFDPALLAAGGIPVRPGGAYQDPLGCFRLEPRCGATLTLTLEVASSLRDGATRAQAPAAWSSSARARPLYSILPVPAPPHSFRQSWTASFHRGRVMPLRIARRRGGTIARYGERPGTLEILRPEGRVQIPLPPDPVALLSETFGIAAVCLRAWFDNNAGRASRGT